MSKPRTKKKGNDPRATSAGRGKARRFALQALYQMKMTGCSAAEVESQFLQDHEMKRVDTAYLHELLAGISEHKEELSTQIKSRLDRDIDELDPVEMAALYVSTFELIHRIDIPHRVVINEGVELAKQFGAAESHKFVNSVLDGLAKDHRQDEYGLS